MTDFLDEKQKEINDRLKELKPLVDEYARLEAAASALAGVSPSVSTSKAPSSTGRRGPGRPRGSSTARATTTTKAPKATKARKARKTGKRAGRRKGSGTRGAGVRQARVLCHGVVKRCVDERRISPHVQRRVGGFSFVCASSASPSWTPDPD